MLRKSGGSGVPRREQDGGHPISEPAAHAPRGTRRNVAIKAGRRYHPPQNASSVALMTSFMKAGVPVPPSDVCTLIR